MSTKTLTHYLNGFRLGKKNPKRVFFIFLLQKNYFKTIAHKSKNKN